MRTVVAIAVTVALWIAGRVRLRRRFAQQAEHLDLVREVTQNLIAFGESRGADGAKYAWLLGRATKLHAALGEQAFVEEYRTAYWGPVYPNFATVNLIQEIRKSFERDAQSGNTSRPVGPEVTLMLLEVLTVRDGRLCDLMEATANQRRNIAACLREGVSAVLLFLLDLLQGFDLLSADRVQRASRSSYLRSIAGLFALVAPAATLIGLYADLRSLGWLPRDDAAPSAPHAVVASTSVASPASVGSPTTEAMRATPMETPAEPTSPRIPDTTASP